MTSILATARCVRTTTVAVVDSHPEDYAAVPIAIHRADMTWHFLATGREALRMAAAETVDLWVVNIVLPDMPGSELCGMLRSGSPPPTVYVVADSYRAEDERAARLCGASLFVCKPVQAEWFNIETRAAWRRKTATARPGAAKHA